MKKRLAFGLLMASFMIAGCQSTGVKPNPSQTPQNSLAAANALLSNAALLQGSAQQAQMLAAAEAYVQLGEYSRALKVCSSLAPESLGDALYAKHQQIQSRSLLATGNVYAAKGNLESERLTRLLPTLNPKLAAQLREFRAEVYYQLGDISLSVNERISMGQLQAQSDDAQINREYIWMALMELDIQQLTTAYQQSTSDKQRGWYELALVSKNNQRNISQQFAALKQWQHAWPSHPANSPLPADLQLIANIVNNQPKHIALLLPFSGRLAPVSEAIRDGFMAAYYTNSQSGGQAPEIAVYDVSQGDINEHYQLAVSRGAQVVVGPLSKEKISELALNPTLAVPTLALNQIEASSSHPPQLFQLGLGVEDEATAAAERAFKDGKRTALIFTPAGTQGDRATQMFDSQWKALGGTVVDAIRYSNPRELSGLIERTMHIGASNNRAKALRGIVGNVEFEPRRRQDIDCIFLVAQAREARQIKPLLAYHYAGNIPVYSTSSIYEGDHDSEPDLNGINFSQLPWFFQNSPEKTAITQGKALNARTQRLYALGVDAYYLYPRLAQLENANRANFWGQTGVLSLNEHRQFLRKQQWARFKRGRVVPLVAQPEDILTDEMSDLPLDNDQ